jgi:hypothetical protein
MDIPPSPPPVQSNRIPHNDYEAEGEVEVEVEDIPSTTPYI